MRFIKIRSLFLSLSVPQFHRATTLRTPRELPATAQTEKVLFVNIPSLYTLHYILAFTPYTLRPTPKNLPKIRFLFAQSKKKHYLCGRIYVGGDMSLAKSVSRGAFYRVGSDILIAFIDALCLMCET